MDHWLVQRRQSAIEYLEQSGWLKHVQWLPEIDSTNSLARRLLVAGLDELPALFIADRQTAGRGRSVRQWWSPPGCLMFSLVVTQDHLPHSPALWPQLSLVAGVAAAQAIESHLPGVNVKLKWPNDLYLDDRKLAGILVEAIPRGGDGRMAFVIGVGLNVAVDWSDAPPELRQRACSLVQFTALEVNVEDVLIKVIEQLAQALDQWRTSETNWWQQWHDRSLLTGCTVRLQLPDSVQLIGQCEGIDSSGRLLVRDASQCHHVQSAEVIAWQDSQ